MLWGAGTALGEVPPYAFSYHAAKAGKQNEDLEKMFGMRSTQGQHGFVGGLVMRMKNWMLQFIKRYACLTGLKQWKHVDVYSVQTVQTIEAASLNGVDQWWRSSSASELSTAEGVVSMQHARECE